MKNLISQIDWSKNNGLVPAIIQDVDAGTVLMLGYMNKQALAATIKTKNIWFYSRSKKRLWMKGATSKNILTPVEIKPDCDNDALLIKAKPAGPTCHTGDYSCFRENTKTDELSELFKVIRERKILMPKNSYSASLFKAGLSKISLKVVEEALEVIQAAQKQTKQRLIEESVDLIYHLFVLLVQNNIKLENVKKELNCRKPANAY